MPKNDDNKIIFIHIPKTGGTYVDINILKIDFRNIDINTIKKNFIGYNEISYSHMTLFELSRMINIIEYEYIFTFVRNPYDRFVSNYFYNGYLFIAKNFDEFVHDLQDYIINNKNIFIKEISNEQMIQLNKHYRLNQIDFLMLNNEIYDRIKVFKFENFETGIRTIISDLKLNSEYSNEKVNNTIHDDYKSYYNKQTSEIVYNLYNRDFEYFKYDKLIIE